MWNQRPGALTRSVIGAISLLALFGCATQEPIEGDSKAAQQLEQSTADEITNNLYEAFRSRARAQDTVTVAKQMVANDPSRLLKVRQAYTAAAASGDALLEAYKASIEEKLFRQAGLPSTSQTVNQLAAQMLRDEQSLNKLVYVDPGAQSVQTVDSVITALNGIYKLIWGAFSDWRDAQRKDKEAYLERVRQRVDRYRWRGWDELASQPPSPATKESGR